MKITVPHTIGREAAKEKIEQKVGALLGQFSHQADDLHHEWTGDTLHFKGKAKGFKVEGTVEVTDADVVIDGKLPLMALPFEGRIREAVEKEADKMFRA